MANTLTSEIKVSVGWLHQDALDLSMVSDSSRLDYHAALADGIGSDQADEIWHDLRTLAAGDGEDLNLSALPLSLFGSAMTLGMAKVKAILLINTSENAGDNLVLGGAASHPWQGPFAAAGETLVIPADSCLLLMNKKTGWAVAAGSADQLHLENPGAGDISYKIAILGTSA